MTWTRPTSKTTGKTVMNPISFDLNSAKITRITGSTRHHPQLVHLTWYSPIIHRPHVPADQRRECTYTPVNKGVGDGGYYASLSHKERWRGKRVKHLPFSIAFKGLLLASSLLTWSGDVATSTGCLKPRYSLYYQDWKYCRAQATAPISLLNHHIPHHSRRNPSC